MPTVHVRDATAADAEAIAGLVNRAFLVERFFVEGDRTSPAEISRLRDALCRRKGCRVPARFIVMTKPLA